LEEEFAARVEYENVNGAMLEAFAVDDAAWLSIDDLVAVVDDVENFFAHRRTMQNVSCRDNEISRKRDSADFQTRGYVRAGAESAVR